MIKNLIKTLKKTMLFDAPIVMYSAVEETLCHSLHIGIDKILPENISVKVKFFSPLSIPPCSLLLIRLQKHGTSPVFGALRK